MSGSSGNIFSPSGSDLNAQNQQYQSLSGGLANSAYSVGNVAPTASNLGAAGASNPFAPQAQAGAQTASTYGTGTVVPQQQQAAASLQGLGNQNASFAPQALAQGFDPMNANYNRLFQQNQDQTNATNAMSGVSNSPYGAGVANESNINFNSNWLDKLLGRENTAASTAATLTGGANTAYTGAANQGTGAISTEASASGLPASTYNQNIMDSLRALTGETTAAGGAAGVQDQALQQILSYLGYGTDATKAQQAQSNSTFAGLGQLAGQLGSAALLAG